MNHKNLLTNHLSNLQVDLFMVNFNRCDTDWRDLDYTPDYSKFYLICEGEGWLKIGDQEYYPAPGQLFLMPEGVTQSYSAISDRPFLKYWCHFSARVGGINLFQILNFPHFCTFDRPELIQEIFNSILDYARSGEVYAHMMAKSKLIELLSHYIMHLDQEQISYINVSVMEKISAILAYIDSNIEENISVRDLAQIAYMHPNYFIRFFKQRIGVPPIHYIASKKMDKAKELLTCTSKTVTAIAEHLGFSDLYYFSRQFKKHTGLNPTEYRKQIIGRTVKEMIDCPQPNETELHKGTPLS
ncbi:AraC family transcriptional regulator [Paenibacillus taichungensis]|uniref:AraC family transcriptional regulator n=1 Tax=Paenibacillus taichungensis TaxID=484184 RepID=A0ABX2MR53_9BACL|nr:AraC family transcriptional regulator [Paenibacillus taichungensis]NUU56500.1 AraC family transcriptional regulator [Paenibacillus taichungensis]